MWNVLMAAAFVGALAQGDRTAGPAGEEAARVTLARTAEALGGAAALAQVRALRAEGHSTRALGPMRMSAGVELLLDRPGRYIRRESVRLGGTAAETVTGFDGPRFILSGSVPRGAVPAPSAFGPAAAAGLHQQLTLFLIGFFGDAFDGTPLLATSAGTAESPDGGADVVRLRLPNGVEATLFVSTGGLPLMISWLGGDPLGALAFAPPSAPGSRAGPAGTAAGSSAVGAAGVRTAEHRFHFGDYRPVGNVRWPFLVRHSVDGRTIEELRFDRFILNPPIDGSEFRP